MNRNHFFAKARILLPATLMFVTLNAFTQTVPANSKTRPEVTSSNYTVPP